MSDIFYITTWDKKPFIPKHTFVGTLDEIFTMAKECKDCNLKCLKDEIIIAAASASSRSFYETVEDKWHGTVIVAHSTSKSKYDQISRSQRIANKEWADAWNGDPEYILWDADEKNN